MYLLIKWYIKLCLYYVFILSHTTTVCKHTKDLVIVLHKRISWLNLGSNLRPHDYETTNQAQDPHPPNLEYNSKLVNLLFYCLN